MLVFPFPPIKSGACSLISLFWEFADCCSFYCGVFVSHQDLLIFHSDRPENCDRGYLQDFSTPSLPTTTCDNSLRKTLGCPMIFDDMGQFAGKTDATTSLFLIPLQICGPLKRPLDTPVGLLLGKEPVCKSRFCPRPQCNVTKDNMWKEGRLPKLFDWRICLLDVIFWTHMPSDYFLADQTKYFFKPTDHKWITLLLYNIGRSLKEWRQIIFIKYILNSQSKKTTQEKKIVESFERSASCGVW